MVTSLPVFKDRQGIDDVGVSLIVLLVCVTAALGSVTADFLAKWRGSRIALVVGLCLEVVALLLELSVSPIRFDQLYVSIGLSGQYAVVRPAFEITGYRQVYEVYRVPRFGGTGTVSVGWQFL